MPSDLAEVVDNTLASGAESPYRSLGPAVPRCNPTEVLAGLAAKAGRAFRHLLVVAALALLTAVAVGASGVVLSGEVGEASGSSVAGRRSLDVVRSFLGRDEEQTTSAPVVGAPAVSARPSSVQALPPLQRLVATGGGALIRSQERPSHAFATPALRPGDQVLATVSFYYCVEGGGLHPSGDGGGFCGAMRDGRVVYSGAAACDFVYLGQRFRVVGDPLERVYTCNDTGSAVHGLHRDIWFQTSDEGWVWQLVVGPRAVLEILP